ncbi:MAG: hypothetical protein HKP40_10095 [Litoreibacter sp.]|nr:hypothetical protein [Litoreibacter sp.]
MKQPLLKTLLICATCGLGAQSQSQPQAPLLLTCDGTDPDWSLTIGEAHASLDYGRSVTLDIPQRGSAKGRDWPKALTLVGRSDTAIVVLHQQRCDNAIVTGYPIEATVLTQRGEEPVILSGCCRYSD